MTSTGEYANTFRLPASWKPGTDGATVQLTHGNGDMVTAITVNGHKIGQINQVTDTADIGPYLRPGTNTIQVKIDTNLGNRVGRTTQSYGLTGVAFTPYTEVPVPQP